jgi:hypothetical protein
VDVQKTADHKKVLITAGLSFNVPIHTHNCVNFIIRSHYIYSRNMKDRKEEIIL